MDLFVSADGIARFGRHSWRCRLGRSGVTAAKREGDGATPIGAWQLRHILHRADRVTLPPVSLPGRALVLDDGWCDDPADPRYNCPVSLPYPGRTESLWREDALYDVIVPLGYNDDPVIAGLGSAIFLHCARPDGGATEGCVALNLADLLDFVSLATAQTRVIVSP